MDAQQAMTDLATLLHELQVATDALNARGVDLARAERNYRVLLSKYTLRLRAEGMPATILRDVCLGLDAVADARFKRDVAQSQYDATKELINTLKLHARMIDGQLSRDLELTGRTT